MSSIPLFLACADNSSRGNDTKDIPDGYNRLVYEKSPYLQQHAQNPVDWYPWGAEAFERAREEDKPIFLSIGYSTCHWCHVMEHESFENQEVADLMNEGFVSIKVDREERPDIDGIYMTVAQLLTGRGGWPLTIVMTPEKLPFFAGTYIPRETRGNMLGMMDLIPKISELWETEREKIETSADEITAALTKALDGSDPGDAPTHADAQNTFQALSGSYDASHGGFGTAPKFPSPHNLIFLIRYSYATGNADARNMAESTLEAMRFGGIFDHIGFGFHRYSTDREWLVPHFEKMLYDQALLTYAYVEAYAATGRELYRETAAQIIEYVLRDMTGVDGGFYSAEDADSEGEEGKFYLWSLSEVQELAGDLSEKVIEHFGLLENGNYRDEATGAQTGLNILHRDREITGALSSEDEARIRKVLFDTREQRIRPSLDDKILTDWNGLMVAALAKAGVYTGEHRYIESAERAVRFVMDTMVDEEGRLLHRYRNGDASITGTLDDYAFFLWGLMELYDATLDPTYLFHSVHFVDIAVEDFWDETEGGFFFTSDTGEQLIGRQKDSYDSAIPSGNSVMVHVLTRLAHLTGQSDFSDRVQMMGNAFSGEIGRAPAAHALFLASPPFLDMPTREVVIVGRRGENDTESLIQVYRSQYHPGSVLLFKDADGNEADVGTIAPFTKYHEMVDGRATAYVCRDFACELPTNDPIQMAELLAAEGE